MLALTAFCFLCCPCSSEAVEDGGGDESFAGHRHASAASGTAATLLKKIPLTLLCSPYSPLEPYYVPLKQLLNLDPRGTSFLVDIPLVSAAVFPMSFLASSTNPYLHNHSPLEENSIEFTAAPC